MAEKKKSRLLGLTGKLIDRALLVTLGVGIGLYGNSKLAPPEEPAQQVRSVTTDVIYTSDYRHKLDTLRLHFDSEDKTDLAVVVDTQRVRDASGHRYQIDPGTLQSLARNYRPGKSWNPPVYLFATRDAVNRLREDPKANSIARRAISPYLFARRIVIDDPSGRLNPADPNSPSIDWRDLSRVINRTVSPLKRVGTYELIPAQISPYAEPTSN